MPAREGSEHEEGAGVGAVDSLGLGMQGEGTLSRGGERDPWDLHYHHDPGF